MLTAAQLEARRGKLTASMIRPLMTGDAEGIMRLWRIMTGQEAEEDKSHVWAIRLGEVTEQLQLDWFEEKNRVPVERRGEVMTHPEYPWAACTLDGWVENL